jgi:purine-binding chemotaxis protein CheW
MPSVAAGERNASMARSSEEQFLSFRVGSEEYGVDILTVQEIKGYTGVAELPNTPAHIRGIMNLRGTVIPIFDLRARFGLEEQEYTKFTVVVVVRRQEKSVGLVVDAVSDVLDIPADEIREVPECTGRADMGFISGIATIGDKLVVLLNIEKLLSEEEISSAVG